jgi:hypothetical protein
MDAREYDEVISNLECDIEILNKNLRDEKMVTKNYDMLIEIQIEEIKTLKARVDELEKSCNCPRGTINGSTGEYCEFFDDCGGVCDYGKL